MGQPVVHFEVLGRDGARLQSFFSELFNWEFQEVGGPMSYATVDREGNVHEDGAGIGGGVGAIDDGDGHVTFYVEVPDIEASLARVEELGGRRVDGPHEVPGAGIEIAHYTDPEGHLLGLVSPTS